MSDLASERLAELRRIAEAATPGPWDTTRYNGGLRFDGPLRVYAGTDPEYGEPRPIPATDADTRYIAAFDPPTVLALLDEIERLRRERKEADGMSGLTATAPEMTGLRDVFAAKAMHAIITEPAYEGAQSFVMYFKQVLGLKGEGMDAYAQVAYAMADAMLKAREVSNDHHRVD